MKDELIYFAFSETAANKYGYHIAKFKDGSILKYTSIAENEDYFNRTYTFPDKQLLGSKKAIDMLSYEHVELSSVNDLNNTAASKNNNKGDNKDNNLDEEKINPFPIVEKIRHLRENEKLSSESKIIKKNH
jgi:hypothetical protein